MSGNECQEGRAWLKKKGAGPAPLSGRPGARLFNQLESDLVSDQGEDALDAHTNQPAAHKELAMAGARGDQSGAGGVLEVFQADSRCLRREHASSCFQVPGYSAGPAWAGRYG